MKIGIVSDTHNNLANVTRIVELFNAAGVARVVHTGDITQAKTLYVLAGLEAPLCGVWGNNDRERESLESACAELGMSFGEPPLTLHWAQRHITVVHDPLDLTPAIERDSAVLLHGHTHRRVVERGTDRIVFNPGECAGHMQGHNAIGVLDLETLEPDILLF